MSDYYTIFTKIGLAKMANALSLGQTVVLTHFAVGDGGENGDYSPTDTQTSLRGETYRAPVNAINVDPNNPSWLVVEAVIPANRGGWYVREAGLFDQDGDMIAIIRYPETFKPVLESGVGKDLYLRVILEHSNTQLVELKIDPAIVLSTRKFVGDSIDSHNKDANAHEDMLAAHNSDKDAHPDFLRYNRSRTLEAGFWTTPVSAIVVDGDVLFDPAKANRFTLTAAESLTIMAPSPMPAGGSARLQLDMDAAGNHSISFGPGFRINHGQINSDPNAVNLIHMEFNGSLVDVHITQRAGA
ncbi:MAG: putative tail fiber protein [Prokaryotic dsDNA virus sp.]|nr:MAG: putative tail fiber protein [Prokaryotic dsDNA virus sp.]|tara:strand:- start:3246 stop:4142 length:897 start_codon:yes stop_codon:yes gene_type:complete